MEREIKFRAWDEEYQKMWLPYPKDFSQLHCENQFNTIGFFIKNHYTLLQYTDLKDKKGVDIYEGDILESDENSPHLSVEWSDRFGSWLVILLPADYNKLHSSLAEINKKNFSVIGNIYENPDLLTKEQRSK